MARSVIFFVLFLATHASLALLYPFTLPRFLLTALIYRAGTLIMLFLLFHPRNQWLVDNRSRVEGERCIALTFDDGPDPVDTPRLLDLLREKNVKATFFVVGKRADQYPEIVRRAWDEGHLIANHTWSHRHLFCFLTPSRLRAEIERGAEICAAFVVSVRACFARRWVCVTRFCAPISRRRDWSTFPGPFAPATRSPGIPAFSPSAS